MTSRLILAPLRGVTTLTYRTVFATHFGGLDVAMAPFIPTVNAARITILSSSTVPFTSLCLL